MKTKYWTVYLLSVCVIILSVIVFKQQQSIVSYHKMYENDIVVVTVFTPEGKLLAVDYAKSANPKEKDVKIFTTLFTIDYTLEDPVCTNSLEKELNISWPNDKKSIQNLPSVADILLDVKLHPKEEWLPK